MSSSIRCLYRSAFTFIQPMSSVYPSFANNKLLSCNRTINLAPALTIEKFKTPPESWTELIKKKKQKKTGLSNQFVQPMQLFCHAQLDLIHSLHDQHQKLPNSVNLYFSFVRYLKSVISTSFRTTVFVGLMVFNAIFNNISVISCRSVLLVEETRGPGKTIDLSQVSDKLYHIMLFASS